MLGCGKHLSEGLMSLVVRELEPVFVKWTRPCQALERINRFQGRTTRSIYANEFPFTLITTWAQRAHFCLTRSQVAIEWEKLGFQSRGPWGKLDQFKACQGRQTSKGEVYFSCNVPRSCPGSMVYSLIPNVEYVSGRSCHVQMSPGPLESLDINGTWATLELWPVFTYCTKVSGYETIVWVSLNFDLQRMADLDPHLISFRMVVFIRTPFHTSKSLGTIAAFNRVKLSQRWFYLSLGKVTRWWFASFGFERWTDCGLVWIWTAFLWMAQPLREAKQVIKVVQPPPQRTWNKKRMSPTLLRLLLLRGRKMSCSSVSEWGTAESIPTGVWKEEGGTSIYSEEVLPLFWGGPLTAVKKRTRRARGARARFEAIRKKGIFLEMFP